jgi:hypothetical protein
MEIVYEWPILWLVHLGLLVISFLGGVYCFSLQKRRREKRTSFPSKAAPPLIWMKLLFAMCAIYVLPESVAHILLENFLDTARPIFRRVREEMVPSMFVYVFI